MNFPIEIIRRVDEAWKRRMAACEGKVAFDNRGMAESVARRRQREGKANQAYKCRFCGKYHLGGGH
jgi:hypothetical protein